MTMATKRTQQELAWIHFWRTRGLLFSAGEAVHSTMIRPARPKRNRATIISFAALGLVAAVTISVALGLLIAAGFLLQENK